MKINIVNKQLIKMKKTIFLSATLAIALIACKQQQPVTETTPADALCSRLSEISQKGYMFGDKVLRYSMVKVAN